MTHTDSFSNRLRCAALGLALAVACGGCQQVDQLVRKPFGRGSVASSSGRAEARRGDSKRDGLLDRGQRADIQFAVGRSLERRDETSEAIKVYREVLRKDARHSGALHRLAVLHDKQGKWDEARPLFFEALLLDPDNAELHCDAGYSCYLHEDWADAEQHLRRAIELDSDLARAHNNLGLLLARLERNNESLQAFLAGGNDAATARANLGVASLADNRVDTARRQFKLALRSDPEHELALQGMRALRAIAEEGGAAATVAASQVGPKPGIAAEPSERPSDKMPDNDATPEKRDASPRGEALLADAPRHSAPRTTLRLPAVDTVALETDQRDSSRVVWATPTDDDRTEVVPAAPHADGKAAPAPPRRLPADVDGSETGSTQADIDRNDRLPVMQLRD